MIDGGVQESLKIKPNFKRYLVAQFACTLLCAFRQ